MVARSYRRCHSPAFCIGHPVATDATSLQLWNRGRSRSERIPSRPGSSSVSPVPAESGVTPAFVFADQRCHDHQRQRDPVPWGCESNPGVCQHVHRRASGARSWYGDEIKCDIVASRLQERDDGFPGGLYRRRPRPDGKPLRSRQAHVAVSAALGWLQRSFGGRRPDGLLASKAGFVVGMFASTSASQSSSRAASAPASRGLSSARSYRSPGSTSRL